MHEGVVGGGACFTGVQAGQQIIDCMWASRLCRCLPVAVFKSVAGMIMCFIGAEERCSLSCWGSAGGVMPRVWFGVYTVRTVVAVGHHGAPQCRAAVAALVTRHLRVGLLWADLWARECAGLCLPFLQPARTCNVPNGVFETHKVPFIPAALMALLSGDTFFILSVLIAKKATKPHGVIAARQSLATPSHA